MESKLLIYSEMLKIGLQIIRAHSENSDICFLISDLLHNVPKHMLIDDTSDLDAFFIKTEIAAYLAGCRRVNVQPDDRFIALAGKLHEALPLDVRSKIEIPV